MPTPVVWSERPEPNASSLKDCTYSSGLMGLIWGNFTAFPLGIYAVAEREALERSDDQPDETGASLDDLILAVSRRYKLQLSKSRPELLAPLLERADLAFILQGKMGNFPAGHPQRRWDPNFTGEHAVCVVGGIGPNLWLDPLAPNKFIGDKVSDATVQTFAKGSGWFILVRRDVFAPLVYTQKQMDAAMAAAKAANVVAVNASYNSGLTAAQAAVSALPRK